MFGTVRHGLPTATFDFDVWVEPSLMLRSVQPSAESNGSYKTVPQPASTRTNSRSSMIAQGTEAEDSVPICRTTSCAFVAVASVTGASNVAVTTAGS